MKPRLTRAERERNNRAFYAAVVLPAIGGAARLAGLRGDCWFSACLSEVEADPELRHFFKPGRNQS